jgi:hypothetical protein
MTLDNSLYQQVESTKKIEEDIRKVEINVRQLANAASYTSLIGLVVGTISAVALGPFPLIIGAAIGAAAMGGIRLYSLAKKKELKDELSILQSKQKIEESTASKIEKEIDVIYNKPASF